MTRLLFSRSTGLGDRVAEPNEVCDVADPVRVREILCGGRAVLAPTEAPIAEPELEPDEPGEPLEEAPPVDAPAIPPTEAPIAEPGTPRRRR